jgi:D-3-phosphoglycerate dehydrogenase
VEDWERELVNHPRVVVTPHIGAETQEAQRRIAEILVDKLLRIIEAKRI